MVQDAGWNPTLFEPPCSADKGHDWDSSADMFGYTGIRINGGEIAEHFCKRRGCYVTRGVMNVTLPDGRGVQNVGATERLYVVYYGALCEYSIRVHQEEYGMGPGLEEFEGRR